MNRRQITYFLAVANAGGFSRASEQLHVAQPALSARIRELEASIGARLFERHPRGVRLTPHGQALLPHAKEIETAFDRAARALESASAAKDVVISIGVTPAIAATILPALLDVATIGGRAIEWHAQQAAALPLIEMLVAGKIESALIYHNPKHRKLRCIPLLSEDMTLVGLPAVLGETSKDIRLAEVSKFRLVLDQRNHLLRQVIENVVAKRGVSINVYAELEPLPAKRRLMQRGCCTIIPRNAFASELQDGTYVARRVVAPRLTVTLYLLVAADIDPARCDAILAAVRAGLSSAPML